MHQAITLALQNSRDLNSLACNTTWRSTKLASTARPSAPISTPARASHTPMASRRCRGAARLPFSARLPADALQSMLKGEQKAAEDRAKNQKLEMDRVRDDVIVRTATEYLELAKVQHSLDLMRAEQASAEKILEAMRERVAANQELPIEVTRSQLTLARINEQTSSSKTARKRSRNSFAILREYPTASRSRSRARAVVRGRSIRIRHGGPGPAKRSQRGGSRKRARGAAAYSARRTSQLFSDGRHRRAVQHPEQIQ